MIRWIGVALLVAALAGASGYAYQWMQAQSARHGQQIDQQQHHLAALEARLATLAEQRTHDQQSSQDQLIALERTLSQMQSGARDRWFVAEAAALAELAARRLVLTGDAEAALKLMQAADEVLARVADAGILALRKQVAADIQALALAHRVDVEGLVLRLGGLREQARTLSALRQDQPAQVPVAPPSAESASTGQPASTPAEGWQGMWAVLEGVIRVRVHEDDVRLPLTDMQKQLLALSLENDLQQAQLALLNGQPEVFRHALAQAATTLSRWFNPDDAAVAHLQQSLAALQQVSWKQVQPTLVAPAALLQYSREHADPLTKQEPAQ